MSDGNFTYVVEMDGRPGSGCHHNDLDVSKVGKAADALHDKTLAGAVRDSTTDVTGSFLNSSYDFSESQAEAKQPVGINSDLKLLFIASPTVNLRHTGNRAKLRLNQPILC